MPKTPTVALALVISILSPAGQDAPGTRSSQIAVASAAIEVAQMNNLEPIQASVQPQAGSGVHAHADATVTVQNSHAEPYDQGAGPALNEIRLNESFAGDMEGESSVRALQVGPKMQRASLVSMQRFVGKLGGRKGTFVLQGSEIVENGTIKATWFVVPGSGTGDLSGLRGEGGFAGKFGEGSKATLDYWFE